ncbi:MAG: DUF401 family protein [Candidatus Saliniplasma sp.]
MLEFIGVLLAFITLGTLIYKKVGFGYAILLAVGVLLVLSNPTLQGVKWLLEISIEFETIELILIINMIAFLGFLYSDSGQVMRMIKELRGAVPDRRLVIASIPAIFGLMPMPGGALVSAPMIDDEGDELNVDPVHKTFLNWWFRHIWFTIYPLSLGLILASSITGVSLYRIALYNTPIFAIQIVCGVIWGIGGIEAVKSERLSTRPLLLVWELMPIMLALSLNIILSIPFYLSLPVAILFLLFQNRDKYNLSDVPVTAKNGFSFNLILAAYGIMLFKGIIERTNGIAPVVTSLQNHVPIFLVVVLFALAIGMFLGHLPSAVGIGLPVLLPLISTVSVRTIGVIYLFTFLGYLLSPIHLCIILTVEYFGTNLKAFYSHIWKPTLVLIVFIFVWITISGAVFLF